jgi:hypothetical protein
MMDCAFSLELLMAPMTAFLVTRLTAEMRFSTISNLHVQFLAKKLSSNHAADAAILMVFALCVFG